MSYGIFENITGLLLKIPGMLEIVFPVGFVGLVVVFIIMPIRLFWIMVFHFAPGNEPITNKSSHKASYIFLALSAYGAIEIVLLVLLSEPGGFSGLMLPVFSFLPFIFYILSEWARFNAYK